MRILIVGFTSFVASHLTAALKRRFERKCQDYEIVGIGRPDRVEQAIRGADVVYHLAAQTEVGRAVKDPAETFEGNIGGTWRVLDACRKYAPQARIIVASSDKCYGWTPPPYREEDPVRATAPYETSKACADLIAQTYQKTYGMDIAITRFGNFYGPGRLNWTTLIPGTIKSIFEGKKPVLRTDGTFRRDFLFIEDGVEAYVKLAFHSQAKGAYNFGTGKPNRVIDVVEEICRQMGWKDGITIIEDSKNEIVDQYLDCSKAERDLQWKASHTLEEGLAKTIPWYVAYLGGDR